MTANLNLHLVFKVRHSINQIVFCLALVLLSACNFDAVQAGSKANESKAYFDYFNYEGKDDFYINNKLPSADAFYNPILPGWYPDPSICKNGEDYFLVTSTFAYFPGVPLFHSRDLINWKQIGHVLDRSSQLKLEGQFTSQGILAPAISYNPHNKTYYMITTNIGGGNFFVKTKDPFSSWSDPVWLTEIHGINPSFFFDDNGRTYVLNTDEPTGGAAYNGHRAIKIREFDIVNEKVVGAEKELINCGLNIKELPLWIEGPHMYKIKDKYYLIAAEGGNGLNHSEIVLKSSHPMGDFVEFNENPILTQKSLDTNRLNPVSCVGHADLVKDELGNWWSLFLGCRPINNKFENLGRETFLMPIRWTKDGFPYLTKCGEQVPLIIKKPGVKRNCTVTFGNFIKNDDFNSDTLGMEWLTLRSPAYDCYSLNDEKGKLALKVSNISATETKVPSFICRRIQHHKFEVKSKIQLQTKDMNEKAGILLYKDESHQYFLAAGYNDLTMTISLYKISEQGEVIIAKESYGTKSNEVYLKVDSEGTFFKFYFGKQEDSWSLLADQIDAHYLSNANTFGFTGTTIGMYATIEKENKNNMIN